MLAAFEATMRVSAKDDAEYERRYAELAAEPKEVRDQRVATEASTGVKAPKRQGVTMKDAQALMASFAASEAQYR